MNPVKPIVVVQWNTAPADREPSREPTWWSKRLAMWESLTLRALLRQEYNRFECWVLIDDATSEASRAKLRATLPDTRFMVMKLQQAQARAREHLPKDPHRERFVICRVDPDMSVHKSLIGQYTQSARAARHRFIQPVMGYAFDVKSRRLYEYRDMSPHCYAIVVSRGELAADGLPGVPLLWTRSDVKDRAVRLSSCPLFCVLIHSTGGISLDDPRVGAGVTGVRYERAGQAFGFGKVKGQQPCLLQP